MFSTAPPKKEKLSHLLINSNQLLKKVHRSSSELLEKCEGHRSHFRFIHLILYILFLVGGFVLGYCYFSYRRDPLKESYYNKYPSSLLGDSDVF